MATSTLESAGRSFKVGQHQAFLREEGQGEPVVCMHGVPASSFLYRKMLPLLAQKGYRALAFDLLGMGLSDKPKDFDYSWTHLGKWCSQAIEALALQKYHLILHDIGGPLACEMIGHHPERVRSVTLLNTPIANLGSFKMPFPMFFFEQRGLGEMFLAGTVPFLFRFLMHWRGIHKKESFHLKDAQAYIQLLNHRDKGRSFLKIMRSFEATPAKEEQYIQALKNLAVPIQIVWGVNDPGLTLAKHGTPLQKSLGLEGITQLPGSHFLQEDYPEEIVEATIRMIQNP